jgi:hypothetical protein
LLTLGEVLFSLSQDKDVVISRLFTGEESENFKTIEISYQNIPFEHEENCHMFELRDISQLQKLQDQEQ